MYVSENVLETLSRKQALVCLGFASALAHRTVSCEASPCPGGACEEMQAADKIWSGEHGASPSSDTVFFTIAVSSRVPGTMLSASSFHCVLTTSLGGWV